MSKSVLQDWIQELTLMQQAVLLASIRGPDGIRKDHISKKLLRWLRRCTLLAAFGGHILPRPFDLNSSVPEGGSFTGASITRDRANAELFIYRDEFNRQHHAATWQLAMDGVLSGYLMTLDEVPHHFQLHFMHAAEILGYKHPDKEIRDWWNKTYLRLVNDMHLYPESEFIMNRRLGDDESNWRSAEEVTAS